MESNEMTGEEREVIDSIITFEDLIAGDVVTEEDLEPVS